MKATGIIRKTDSLGRIVLPVELREQFHIGEKDPIEIFTQDNLIILKPYQAHKECLITGEVSTENKTLTEGNITVSKNGAKQLIESLYDFAYS